MQVNIINLKHMFCLIYIQFTLHVGVECSLKYIIGDSARRVRIIYYTGIPAFNPNRLKLSTIPGHHLMVKYILDIYVHCTDMRFGRYIIMGRSCLLGNTRSHSHVDWREQYIKTFTLLLRKDQTIVICWG